MQTRSIFVIRWVALIVMSILLFACEAQSPSVSQPVPPTPLPTTAPAIATPEPATPTIAPTATTAPAEPQALFLTSDRQIVAWDMSTQSTQVVTKLPADTYTITLAPNGQAVAYVSQSKIFIRDLASGADVDSTPAKVKVDLSSSDLLPFSFAWSPDSTKLLFSLNTGDSSSEQIIPMIYIASRDGKPPCSLMPGFGAAWSPVTDRIAYAGPQFKPIGPHGGGYGGVFSIINPDEASGHGVTGADSFFPEWQPVHWSADGSRVAVGMGIYDTATSKLVLRVPEAEGQEVDGAIQYLSADGRAYGLWRNIRTRTNTDTDEHLTAHDEIAIGGADGTTRVIMQSPERECPCLALSAKLYATWNGDGSAILVTEDVPDVVSELRLYDGNGKLMWGLPLPSVTVLPIWSPDGTAALLSNRVGDHDNVLIASLGGGKLQPVGAGIALGWRKQLLTTPQALVPPTPAPVGTLPPRSP